MRKFSLQPAVKKLRGTGFLVPLVFFLPSVFAEPPVVDVGEGTSVQAASSGDAVYNPQQEYQAAQSTNSSFQEFNELQNLREEVMQLRGLVEELSHQIKVLKQQHMDDYIDLDGRIANLTTAGTVTEKTETDSPVSLPLNLKLTASEKDSYSAAYNLLKERKVDESAAAFEKHLEQYPDGELAANAYYWLGEIYLLKGELDQSANMFANLLDKFPQSRKAEDSRFKLGKVLYQQGKTADAKKFIENVAKGDSPTAKLAAEFLKANYPD
jgi:tol-pal system protein YbgF